VARKSSEVRQKSKTEQGRGESVGEEYSAPRGKCAVKRGRIIWRKRGANNIENRRRVQKRRRRRRRKYAQ